MTNGGALKKKQRVGSNSRLSSTAGMDSSFPDGTLAEGSHKSPTIRRSSSSHSLIPIIPSFVRGFNDPKTSDILLYLHLESSSDASPPVNQSEIQIYLHSRVLGRSKYFAALLSDRWQPQNEPPSSNNSENASKISRLNLTVPADAESLNHHLLVLQLLYSDDLLSSIDSVSTALNLLPVALKLLFEDCIKACVKFLEAIPWSEEEEEKVLSLIPLLGNEESKELIARVSPARSDLSEEMLHGLILTATSSQPNMAFGKAFVAKLLKSFSSTESARKVLDKAFENTLKVMKQSLEEYSSPEFRRDLTDTEAVQRYKLHQVMTTGRHLLWLVERMIELKVADSAVKAWSEQASFTADLKKAFHDDAWKNFVPGLPAVILRCTMKLATAVATGNYIATRQVRMKLVSDWLPVVIICRDTNVSPMGLNHKTTFRELEETFLKIISTLPLSDAQDLLQQCLGFSTRNVDDSPHLFSAFSNWFRRANRPPVPQ